MRICLRLLFERALERYHNRQRRTNLMDVWERARLGRRDSRKAATDVIVSEEKEVGVERPGGLNWRVGNAENFADVGMVILFGS